MKKLVIILTTISFLFGGSLSAQNLDFDAYKKSKEAEFEKFKKGQQAEFDSFNKANKAEFDAFKKKRNVFVKIVLFEGTDSSFFENQKLFQKLDSQIFEEMVKNECKNCMYADTVIFRYNPRSWERDIFVKMHSEFTDKPVYFEVTHVGTTFEALMNTLEENFIEIKETMKRQEMAASKGDPNYEYVK